MKKLYFLFFSLLISTTTFAQVINEIDSDTPGTDIEEFIEIKWTPNTSLDGLIVVLYNGSNDLSYATFDLTGFSTDANGFFILGNTGIISAGDLDMGASNILQNGADALAIYQDTAANFPNGTPVTSTNLVDALVYGTGDADDVELLAGLGESVQYDESANGANATESIQRKQDGTYETKAPTFRDENDAAVCELSLTTTFATCDDFTSGTDTYTATVNFAGGGTASYNVNADSGIVGGDDPNSVATGTIIITGVTEGTDVTVTVDGAGGLCNLMSTITSPVCEPSLDLPIYEPFDYTNGTSLVDASGDWENVSSSSDEVIVNLGNLSYSGLPASTGNMVFFGGTGSDPALSFTPVNSGEIFTSFIFTVNDQSAMTDLTDGGYFAVLGDFDLRLWVRPNPDATGSTFDIGFGDIPSSPPFSPSTYDIGTPIFVVMSYNIDTGDHALWINPDSGDLGGSAPAFTMSGTDATPASSIGQFVIRQDSTGETPDMFLDELRIGNTWAEVTGGALSVNDFEISSIRLHPNPTSTGLVTISGSHAEPFEVVVYNILGKQVKTATVNSTLDVSTLKAGVYIVNITQNGISTTKKLVVK